MRISFSSLLLSPLFLASIQASAVPENLIVARAVNCKVVTGVLAVVKALGAPATSFCSSFLHVPATTTIFSTTSPTSTTTATTTTTSGVCAAAKKAKRDPLAEQIQKRAVPAALGQYAVAEISSACSCLSIHPGHTTTSTFTAPTGTKTSTIVFTTCSAPPPPACTANGMQCSLPNPGACCSQTCCNFEVINNGIVPQCC